MKTITRNTDNGRFSYSASSYAQGYEVYECALDVWYSLSHEYQCHSFFKRIYSGMFVVLVERTKDFEILSVEQLIKYLDGSRPYPISFAKAAKLEEVIATAGAHAIHRSMGTFIDGLRGEEFIKALAEHSDWGDVDMFIDRGSHIEFPVRNPYHD